jgi:hypothetical protein
MGMDSGDAEQGSKPLHSRPQRHAAPVVGQERPKLAVIEGFNLTTPLDPYLSLKALVKYSGFSERWLRQRLTDPQHPLPCYRFPGGRETIRVRRSEFDAGVADHRRARDSGQRTAKEARPVA